jgi:phosphoribosylformylglycinamidine synthase II
LGDLNEIRVFPKDEDTRAHELERQAGHLGLEITGVKTSRVFHVEASEYDANLLKNGLLYDSVTETSEIAGRQDWDNPHRIEVAPLPGVTNTEVEPIKKVSELLGIQLGGVASGTEYHFPSHTPIAVIDRVKDELLVNKTVEQVRDHAPSQLNIEGFVGRSEDVLLRDLDEEGLVLLSRQLKLALNGAEMKVAQDHFNKLERNPSRCEMEFIAARWSEHCCHKTFNAELDVDGQREEPLFKRIKNSSLPYFEERGVISAFHDNSGVYRFYDDMAMLTKFETHNSPFKEDPYGGSATGTGGVLRDDQETGQGSRVIGSTHINGLAPINFTKENVPPGCKTPSYLLVRGVAGVGDYGNRMGIPTTAYELHTHPNYRGKPTVLVGAKAITYEKYAEKGIPQSGDLVIAVGAKTGKDGIHGATFSSESADSTTSTVHAGAVQIGDPIAEKKMFDALLEARDRGLIRAQTDCGAAGFASAIGEMAEDIGAEIDLSNAELKYNALEDWEIFLSESQERAVISVAPEHWEEFKAIFNKHESNANVLGTFGTTDGPAKLKVTYEDRLLVDLDYDFLNNGLPQRVMEAEWTPYDIEEVPVQVTDWKNTVNKILSHGSVCSTEPIMRLYDHEVQGMNVLKPFTGVNDDCPNFATVLAPIYDKPYGDIEAHGMNPAITDLDPTEGTKWVFAKAIGNYVAAGGNPDDATLVNNYIAPTPTKRVMGALRNSVKTLTEECVPTFRAPIISGKDSLSSTFTNDDGSTIEAPYNLTITVSGKIPDIAKVVSADIKSPGSKLVLVGEQDLENMGGSILYEVEGGSSNNIPKINLKTFQTTARTVHAAIQTDKILACRNVAEGGVLTAVSQMSFGGNCGVKLDLDPSTTADQQLGNETTGCFVIEVDANEDLDNLFSSSAYRVLGHTTIEKDFTISQGGEDIANLSTDDMKQAWKAPIQELFA